MILRIIILLTSMLCFFDVRAIGWDYGNEESPGWMKIHPSTYIFAVIAILLLCTMRRRYWQTLFSWRFAPYALMSLVLLARAAMLAKASSDPTGAVGWVTMSFVTPMLFFICAASLNDRDRNVLGILLRTFMIASSVLAIGESVTKVSLFYVQDTSYFRAGGLMGHPLAGAFATGLTLVYLLTANNRRLPFVAILPEIVLHTLAIFCYGGRTTLAVVPIVIGLSAILPMRDTGIVKGLTQRLGILLLLLVGVLMTQLNIPFIQDALDRFTTYDTRSADTRMAAFHIMGAMNFGQRLWGIDPITRLNLMTFFQTPLAIEVSWISMIVTFGMLFTIPIFVSLLLLLFSFAWRLDRSALLMVLFFLIVTSSSVSFGSKSLDILRVLILMTGLCVATTRSRVRRVRNTASADSVPDVSLPEVEAAR